MSEFWYNALQTYSAFALLFGAAVLMVDFLANRFGIEGPNFPPKMFVPAMLIWPAALGVLVAAIAYLINKRR